MRRFYLRRASDVSGVSGTGNVAEGCQHDNGWCSLIWLSSRATMSWYESIDSLSAIHSHGGATTVIWIDDESCNVVVTK